MNTIASALNILFLASPLSSIGEVIREKDAASINGPLTITIMLCSSFWGAYAIGINNYQLYVQPAAVDFKFSILTQLCGTFCIHIFLRIILLLRVVWDFHPSFCFCDRLAPQVVGVFLATIQLGLRCFYGDSSSSGTPDSDDGSGSARDKQAYGSINSSPRAVTVRSGSGSGIIYSVMDDQDQDLEQKAGNRASTSTPRGSTVAI